MTLRNINKDMAIRMHLGTFSLGTSDITPARLSVGFRVEHLDSFKAAFSDAVKNPLGRTWSIDNTPENKAAVEAWMLVEAEKLHAQTLAHYKAKFDEARSR